METIKLKAVGNLHLADIENPFEFVSDGQTGADILFGNLDAPFTVWKQTVYDNRIRIKSEPGLAKELSIEGHENVVMNLANDHIFDYDIEGLSDTISLLEEQRIGFFGAGKNLNYSRKPLINTISGKAIGFLGYAWDFTGAKHAGLKYGTEDGSGVAPLNRQLIIKDIKELKKSTDYIVISLHWGYEDELYPMPSQRKLAQDLINRGANLVLGHHPNLVQGIEEYNGGLIVYSLGNFAHKNDNNLLIKNGNKSIILDCEFWGDQIVWDIIPVEIQGDGRPKVIQNTEFKRYVKEELSQWFQMANYGFCWNEFRLRKDLGDEMREKINENI